MRNFKVLPLLLGLILSFPVAALAQGGWAGENRGSITRVQAEQITVFATPATEGSGTVIQTTLSGVTVGDDLPTTPPVGPRTLAVRFTEDSGSDAKFTVQITGKNQFGGDARETFAFESSGLAIGTIAFCPISTPTVTVLRAESVAAADTLSIYPYGFALKSAPVGAGDIKSEVVYNGTTYAEQRQLGAWDFGARYSRQHSTYANPALTAGNAVHFWIVTGSYSPNSVSHSSWSTPSPVFQSVKEGE